MLPLSAYEFATGCPVLTWPMPCYQVLHIGAKYSLTVPGKCNAMPSTDRAYGRWRLPTRSISHRYAMPGTDVGYGATRRERSQQGELAYSATRTCIGRTRDTRKTYCTWRGVPRPRASHPVEWTTSVGECMRDTITRKGCSLGGSTGGSAGGSTGGIMRARRYLLPQLSDFLLLLSPRSLSPPLLPFPIPFPHFSSLLCRSLCGSSVRRSFLLSASGQSLSERTGVLHMKFGTSVAPPRQPAEPHLEIRLNSQGAPSAEMHVRWCEQVQRDGEGRGLGPHRQ
eukprot:927945-Rhodomonas_salina.1